MIADAADISDGERLRADLCIAGAGAAGITIARDLLSEDLDVVVLEGGPLEDSNVPRGGEPGSSLYEGNAAGLQIDLSGSRVRAFGGSTNHWGGWCRPMDPADFSSDGHPEGIGWPISYDELVPYYIRAHDTCGIGKFHYDAREISEHEGKSLLDFGESSLQNVIYQKSPPIRFGGAYRSDFVNSDIRVYTNATLVDIVSSSDDGRIRRFDCETLNGTGFEVSADRFVLAMGGLENPRLLLASLGQSVSNENDLVGRYFMQHPHFATEACVFLEQFDQSAYDWHRAETFDESSGEWFGTVLRGAIGVDSTIRRDQNLPNIACTLEPVDSDAGDFPPVSNVDATSIRQFLPEEVGLYRLFIRGEQTPIRESRVALGDETDMFGIPRLEVDWRIADRDLRAYGHYLKKVGAEFARLGLGRIWTRLDADDRLDFESVWGGGHHMGTTKMSENPVDGVVNPDCRIHAIENLYVAGSSVFPTVGYANPTLTIVALAHRLADHLKEVSG